jgi:hypothetical protein
MRAGSRNSRGGRRVALKEEGVAGAVPAEAAGAVLAEAAGVRQVSGSLLGGDSEGDAEGRGGRGTNKVSDGSLPRA